MRALVLGVLGVLGCGRIGFDPGARDQLDAAVRGCGNGTVEGGEVCDDGNEAFDDGCTPSCVLEDQGPGGRSCDTPRVLALVPLADGRLGAVGSGTTVGGVDTIRSSCIPNTPSPEAIYKLEIDTPGELEIVVEPSSSDNGDALLYVLGIPAGTDDCGPPAVDLACVDVAGPAVLESTTIPVTPGIHLIVIELLRNGDVATPGASYKLDVTLAP